MFDNIGNKIKGLALAMFITLMLTSIISGISIIIDDDDMALIGILVMVGGSLISWVSSWLLYGFGQLVENSDIIAEYCQHKHKNQPNRAPQKSGQKQAPGHKSVSKMLANPSVDEDEFIDILCPHCANELSYTKSLLQSGEPLICPMCDSPITLGK